ncbi:MAG: hypothetical protein PHS67_02400, partial [Sphaerochaetaceae bacterium]|nr:hypothetical protein [Sphaerochaetaceae bacterium]
MKKISAVLLVMVLVGSVAFAGFTGEASVSFGADLDTKFYGFDNATKVSAEVTIFELLVDKAGEGDIYAEISAELTFGFDFEDIYAAPTGDAEITSAKIRGNNWYVGILGAMKAPNFAKSAIDKDKTADKKYLDLNPADFVGKNAGVEVMYADYVFGLSIDDGLNKIDGSIYNIFGSVKTPTYEFADGLTVAFGAAALLADTGKAASGSAKVAYATDDYSASLATDI